MALGGGMSCVKYLLFAFNLLFAITGLVVLAVGIKALIDSSPYVDLSDERLYTSLPVLLIIVGIIVFVVAFFGCFGAVKENHCMVVTFSVFLLFIFVAELAIGIAGYMEHNNLEKTISKQLEKSITDYSTDASVKKMFDMVQTELYCCGINGPKDWTNKSMTIPESCCDGQEINSAGVITMPCSITSEHIHSAGCLPKLVEYFNHIAVILGGVGIGIAVVQLLGVIFACFLARSIRSQYETV